MSGWKSAAPGAAINWQCPGTTDGELYSYTLAMLITSVALLFLAFSRRSVLLRRIAMIGIALTIAKVFLIDMSGLAGLVRVASFLGLGLSLAGLAWVNRKMTEQWDPPLPGGRTNSSRLRLNTRPAPKRGAGSRI